jgi:hypothetical protein
VKPGFKTILEGHRGDIEVIAQALKAEVAYFFHGVTLRGFWREQQGEIPIDL